MIEKQTINGRDFWVQVVPQPVERERPNIIPTEYFTATYYTEDPQGNQTTGSTIEDEEGEAKLFESPVAALSYASKRLERIGSEQNR
jgi:hypothetical protein